jgi:hypothetical protein
MMRRFGGDGTMVTLTGGTYNSETSTMEPTVTTYDIRAMIFDYVPKQDGVGQENRTLIRNGDKQLLVKTSEEHPAPMPNDKITFGGVTYSVVVVKDLNPSGSQSIYYEVYLRE